MQHRPEINGPRVGTAQRLVWPDALKGLAIILVVIGHAWRGIEKPGLIAPELFAAVDQRIYAFHMPLFFLVSGMFFLRVLTRGPAVPFFKGRLLRLIWPLLLWSYIFMLAKLLAGSTANQPLTSDELTLLPIPGQWHMWFLWALFVIHVAMLPLQTLLVSHGGRITILLASLPLSMIIISPQLYEWVGSALLYLPYFLMGMVMGPYTQRLQPSVWFGAAAAGVFGAVLATQPWLVISGIPRLVVSTILIGSLLTWLIVLPVTIQSALAWVGAFSMAIFLAHVIFSAGVRVILLKLQIYDVALHMCLGTLVGLVAPIILCKLAQRLGMAQALGFSG